MVHHKQKELLLTYSAMDDPGQHTYDADEEDWHEVLQDTRTLNTDKHCQPATLLLSPHSKSSRLEQGHPTGQKVTAEVNNQRHMEDIHSRVIIHLDVDCFYAQVEELRDPHHLKGKPIGAVALNSVSLSLRACFFHLV